MSAMPIPSHALAKIIGPASFLYDFLCQQKGIMLDKPNMEVISNKWVAAFSPHPKSIGAFFTPQQLLQVYWLSKLFRKDQSNLEQRKYMPYYVLGNVMIGTWMFFWNSEQMKYANIFVTINSLAQFYYCYMEIAPSTPENRVTRLVAQTFAGVGLLDLLHNTSIAFFREVAPNTLTKLATAVGFPLAAFASSPVLGACYAYDVLGLILGQRNYQIGGESWLNVLYGTFALTVGAVAGRIGWNYLKAKREFGSGVGGDRTPLLDGEGNSFSSRTGR